jgi:hypothetical protein
MRRLHVHYLAADHVRLWCLLKPGLVRPQVESLHALRATCRVVTALLPAAVLRLDMLFEQSTATHLGKCLLWSCLRDVAHPNLPHSNAAQVRSAAVLKQHMLVKTATAQTQAYSRWRGL